MQQGDQGTEKPGITISRTINLPTVLTVITMMVSGGMYIIDKVGDIQQKQAANSREVEVAKAEIKRIENNQIAAQRDVRDDLKDINGKLDRLADRLFQSSGAGRTDTKGWTR